MNHDEQMDWITRREYALPDWDSREIELRRLAPEYARKALDSKTGPLTVVSMKAPTAAKFGGFEEVRIDPIRVGGTSQILLTEELLRQAYGISFEQDSFARLHAARRALLP